MCGIIGVCGKILVKEENVFKAMLCLDTIRGPDSTGVLAVSGSTGHEIFKKVGTPWDCFSEAAFEKIFKYTNVLLLGHNRAATVGTVIEKNAHPFDVGEIIGVHNGTLRNERKLDDHEFFDVDSETLLHNFANNGVAETVKILDGAFAVVFYDKRDHTVHFVRNKERPLFYAYSKDMKTLFWASEAWMLQIACARYGVEIGDPHELEAMVEQVLKLPTQPNPSAVGELPPVARTFLFKEEPKPHSCGIIPWRQVPATKPHIVAGVSTKEAYAAKYKKMIAFVGKDVDFSVSGFVDGKHQKFFRAYAEVPDADVIEIRIFMDSKNKRFKELDGGKEKFWRGHVKRLNSIDMQRGYLLLDNRTIKPIDRRIVPSTINLKEKVFNLFHAKIVNCQEWLDATACGCDNCGDIPQIREADQLEWYDNDKFFCKKCYGTQNVQNYLSLLPED